MGSACSKARPSLLFAFGGVSLFLHLASFAWGAGTSWFLAHTPLPCIVSNTSCSFHPVAGQNATPFLVRGPGLVLSWADAPGASPNAPLTSFQPISEIHCSAGLFFHQEHHPGPGPTRPQSPTTQAASTVPPKTHFGPSIEESHQPIMLLKLPKVDANPSSSFPRLSFLSSSSPLSSPPHIPRFYHQ